jgi:cysteinyl-tRNA synthetase
MSKSLNNFYTLTDIKEKGFDPLAFRLMVLQSHYRSQSNFTWENLESAQNRLKGYQELSDLQFQAEDANTLGNDYFSEKGDSLIKALGDDLALSEVLKTVSETSDHIYEYGQGLSFVNLQAFSDFLELLDNILGLHLLGRKDLTEEQWTKIRERDTARVTGDWTKADAIRESLKKEGVGLRDLAGTQVWYRL